MDIRDLPALNASLNALAALLLGAGYFFIRRGQVERHRLCMVGAFSVSCFFLASYLVYHYHAGSTPFTGQGWVRPVYFTILVTHIVLAAVIVPLACVTLFRALEERFDRHRAIARWTLPLWLYVSVSGVVIYWMLYRI